VEFNYHNCGVGDARVERPIEEAPSVLAPFLPLGYRSSMPRNALTLSNVREPTLTLVCQPCARRGRYAVTRLIEKHGDARLTDLLQTLADCPKARSASIYDRCKVVYEGL
jgi:hypothetical protein